MGSNVLGRLHQLFKLSLQIFFVDLNGHNSLTTIPWCKWVLVLGQQIVGASLEPIFQIKSQFLVGTGVWIYMYWSATV